MPEKNKICNSCNEEKTLSHFRARNDAISNKCKKCVLTQNNASRRKRIATVRSQAKDRFHTPEGRYISYKKRCKYNKIQFELTKEQFLEIIINPCVYCGRFSTNKNYCGIDRVNNDIGYVKSNCLPCCEICNKMKLTYSTTQFMENVRLVYERWYSPAK